VIANNNEFINKFIGEIRTLLNKQNISNDTVISKSLNHRELFYLYHYILEKYSLNIDFMDCQTPQQVASLIIKR